VFVNGLQIQFCQEDEFEDTKGVIRICKSKEDLQHNGQKKKGLKKWQQSTKHTHKTKDRDTNLIKNGGWTHVLRKGKQFLLSFHCSTDVTSGPMTSLPATSLPVKATSGSTTAQHHRKCDFVRPYKLLRKVSWKVERYGQYGRKASWIVKKIWKIQKKSRLNSEMIRKIWKKGKLNSDKIWIIWKKGKLKCEKIWHFPYLFTIQLGFLPYFPYLFTFQLAFLPYCPYLITIQLAFLPYFPYHFTIQLG
jgi:hypothetical protein